MGEANIWRKRCPLPYIPPPPPTVTGTTIPGLPFPAWETVPPWRRERRTGLQNRGRHPWATSAGLPPRGDLPPAGCRTHIVNGARGRASRWAGLTGGGGGGSSNRGVDSSPAAATPAFSPWSRPLLVPLRRRRRRARPGCPECTARRERLLQSRREEESVGKGARGRRRNVRACEGW